MCVCVCVCKPLTALGIMWDKEVTVFKGKNQLDQVSGDDGL